MLEKADSPRSSSPARETNSGQSRPFTDPPAPLNQEPAKRHLRLEGSEQGAVQEAPGCSCRPSITVLQNTPSFISEHELAEKNSTLTARQHPQRTVNKQNVYCDPALYCMLHAIHHICIIMYYLPYYVIKIHYVTLYNFL